MTLALARSIPIRALLVRAWLAACAATVAIAIAVAAISGQASTAVAETTSPAPAVTSAVISVEEPWVPGVMTFSGEPAPRTAPTAVDELDPNCFCIGFF